MNGIHEVRGSIPLGSTKFFKIIGRPSWAPFCGRVIGRDLVLVQFQIGQILRAGSADGSSALSAKRERINRYDFLEEGDDFAPSARCGRDVRVPSSKVMNRSN